VDSYLQVLSFFLFDLMLALASLLFRSTSITRPRLGAYPDTKSPSPISTHYSPSTPQNTMIPFLPFSFRLLSALHQLRKLPRRQTRLLQLNAKHCIPFSFPFLGVGSGCVWSAKSVGTGLAWYGMAWQSKNGAEQGGAKPKGIVPSPFRTRGARCVYVYRR
jgi:hypothetical protein